MNKTDNISVITFYGKKESVVNMICTIFSNKEDAKNHCMVNNKLHLNTDEWINSRIVLNDKSYHIGRPQRVNFNIIYQLDQDEMINLMEACHSGWGIEEWPKVLKNADEKTINRLYKAIEICENDTVFGSLDLFKQKINEYSVDHDEVSSLEKLICIELVHLSIEGKISILNLMFDDE